MASVVTPPKPTTTGDLHPPFDVYSKDDTALLKLVPTLEFGPASEKVKDLKIVVGGGSVGGLAVAACLKKAGFSNVKVFERSPADTRAGAGVAIDDATVAIFKGLGVVDDIVLQPARWIEDLIAGDKLLQRQPYPYWSTRYMDVVEGLLTNVKDWTTFHRRVSAIDEDGDKVKVTSYEGDTKFTEDADIFIAADGPRSNFRQLVLKGDEQAPGMRYAGYIAWRGTCKEATLTEELKTQLYAELPFLGNSILFLHCKKNSEKQLQSGVLYDIGKGVLNWLVYENFQVPPSAAKGRTSSGKLSDEEVQAFFDDNTTEKWGAAFGGLIAATPKEQIFQTDVYDMMDPLPRLCNDKGTVAIMGDAAHATTPHAAKGSNMAVCDAYALARASETATSKADWLSKFSELRCHETANTFLFSRLLGRLRNGLLPGFPHTPPKDQKEFVERALSDPNLEPRMLPAASIFDPVWKFSLEQCKFQEIAYHDPVNVSPTSYFYLVKHRPLSMKAINHVSRETQNLDAMLHFYENILGLQRLDRPNFGFGGAWFSLGPANKPNIALHIIDRDPLKGPAEPTKPPPFDESFIRRDFHIALTVDDIDMVKKRLTNHGINFAVNSVPDKPITQLFVYDPEGNGVEIGNFDNVA